jgi:hypothetical protein
VSHLYGVARHIGVTLTLATMLVVGAAHAAAVEHDSGAISVSGGSVETLRFTVRDIDPPAAEGATIVADGIRAFPAAGNHDANPVVCYALSGEIVVSSNVAYDLLVGGMADPGVRFSAGIPVDYDSCAAGGTVADVTPATSATLSSWASLQPRTRSRSHPFSLGVVAADGSDPVKALSKAWVVVSARTAD